MAAKIIVKKLVPQDVTLAKFLPQFQDEFAELDTISQSCPKSISTHNLGVEIVDGVQVIVTETVFNTVEEAVDASTRTLNWPHEAVIAYNKENNVQTFNKIIDLETDEVIQDWTQRW